MTAHQRINRKHQTPYVAVDNSKTQPSVVKTYGGGSGGITVDTETKNYLDANIRAVKAENHLSSSQIELKIDNLAKEIAQKPGISWLLSVGSAVVLAILAILAFGGDRFDGGVQVQSAISFQFAETQRLSQSNADNIAQLVKLTKSQEEKIDNLINIIEIQKK
jgi:hypothetical protein